LYGSNYWTKHPTVPIAQLNYMINLDMVGRLDSAHTLAVNGVGTSPAWKELEHVTLGGMDLRTTESGIGPSDHSAFYMVDVPAIHFFTGTHEDYHKPGDDAEKLNYEGMLEVARFIESLVTDLSDNGKLAFTKTKEDTAATPRFTVTLGVVPDYMYDGKGMRIDGITEGKPASQAGLKPGDVVVRMGQVEVNDMMGYMKALSLFQKGQTTTVVVLRGGEEVESEVTF
ncbi:MAG: M28 family peptidase, partial [Flavobacteriales bacterium]|nr:M28 family peptidase [Flavobacteriales bacterium]